jgi:hypothetical protein
MQLQRLHLPSIITDNEEAYLSLLQGVVEARDHLASITVTRTLTGYQFRIVPSLSRELETLLQDINSLHNLLQLKVEWGKSLKSGAVVSYKILF